MYDDPIHLPCCGTTICKMHLNDKKDKNGILKCLECNADSLVQKMKIIENVEIKNNLNNIVFLSNEEKKLKKSFTKIFSRLRNHV